MTNTIVSNGQTNSNAIVTSGNTLTISSGGSAVSATISAGGLEAVGNGGSAAYTTISGGGVEIVSSGATATDTALTGGGIQIVLAGGTDVDPTILGVPTPYAPHSGIIFAQSGATVTGGMTSAGVIFIGGSLEYNTTNDYYSWASGGGAMGWTATADEVVAVFGATHGTTLSGGGVEYVYSGASTTGSIVQSGGTEVVSSGGTAFGALLSSGGFLQGYGTMSGTVLSSGGLMNVNSGATAVSGTVLSGATEVVYAGGVTSGDVASGGFIADYGTVSAAVLSSGGFMNVASGARAVSGTVLASATEVIYAGGVTSGDVVSGGFISDNGTVSAAVLSSGGKLTVSAGGSAVSGTTSAGAVEIISAGGSATGGVVSSGGTVSNTGVTSNLAITSGGVENVFSGGLAVSGTLQGSGGLLMVHSSGHVSGMAIANSGIAYVLSGAATTGDVISNGGIEVVSAGATASSAVVSSGGFIQGYGTMSGTTLSAGGLMNVNAGATAISGAILSGATEIVYAGGVTSGDVVSAGGVLYVSSGATQSGGTVLSGGSQIVYSGATVTGVAVQSGGAVVAASTVYASTETGAIVNGNTLELLSGGTVLFSETLSGSYTGDKVTITDASGGHAELTILCFYPGTRIATPTGQVAVEDLAPGDVVLTANGPMPVRWMGQSHVSRRFADRSLPIRIAAGALGAGLPVRDLLVSPDHALFLEGILAQAGALVNGVTITRAQDVPEAFTYHHIELDSHELLFAEGVLAESFVDNADRRHFHNWDERTAPATSLVEMDLPRAKSARQLPLMLRKRLAAAQTA